LDALARRGIGFLELRFPDVDPFQPAGIGEPTLRLLHLFLLDGLARPSIPRPNGDVRFDLDSAEKVALSDSEKPSKHPILFTARDRLETLERWARRLDRRRDDTSYTDTLTDFLGQVADPADLLSARLARFTDLGVTEWKTFPRPGSLRSTPPMKGVFHGLEYAGV
jgi:gamma-glutamylcysteine synthetase